MGTDNLHHKRKNRNLESFRRQEKKRKPYDLVLIICEGEKSEPNYFKELCKTYGLSNTNIKIIPSKKNDPLNIVTHAIEMNKDEKYDRIYCVFDKEQHKNYTEAVNKKTATNIFKITSVPCFEYWLLLHFEDTTAPYRQTQKGCKSEGQQLKSQLKKHIKNYTEGHPNIFEITKNHLQEAIKRAKRIANQQKNNETDNPSTKIYELVEYLIQLKN